MNREPYDASDVRGMYPLRVRGGRGDRGPQIGPHLFEGRSAPNSTKPAAFTALAWSPPSPTFPAVELWCFRDDGNGPRWTAAGVGNRIVWLDMVPDAEGFTPPPGEQPDSGATAAKLRKYAADRLFDLYGIGSANPVVRAAEWTVQVMRPFPGPANTQSTKISPGLYAIKQDTIPQPLAWVWAKDHREIWLTYIPLQQGGMKIPGLPLFGTQSLYVHTKLTFEKIDESIYADWDLADYANTIAQFKAAALGYENSPALNESELEVHDFRVDEIPTAFGRSTPTT